MSHNSHGDSEARGRAHSHWLPRPPLPPATQQTLSTMDWRIDFRSRLSQHSVVPPVPPTLSTNARTPDQLVAQLAAEDALLQQEATHTRPRLASTSSGSNEIDTLSASWQDLALEDPEHEPPATKFAAVLLDGNSFVLDVKFLREGSEGGRRAALGLEHYVKDCLKGSAEFKRMEDIDLMIYTFMNMDKLEQQVKDKFSLPAEVLRDFFRGFASSTVPCVAVDCGPLKYGASDTLNKWLSLLIRQRDCLSIYLGGSRNEDCARILHRLPPKLLEKVILMQTGRITWDNLEEFECREVNFAGLFDVYTEEKAIPLTNNVDVRVEKSSVATSKPMLKQNSGPTGYEIARSLNELGRGPNTKPISQSISDLKIFGPLLSIVRKESLLTPDSNVLRSHVGIVGDFGSIYKNPKYPSIINFKTYTLAAEAAGLVILGAPVGAGAWITLDGANLNKIKQILAPAAPALSAPTASSKPKPFDYINAEGRLGEPEFAPLLNALAHSLDQAPPVVRPLRSHLCIGGAFDHIYKDSRYPDITNFKTYSSAAVLAGFITLGGGSGTDWIELTNYGKMMAGLPLI